MQFNDRHRPKTKTLAGVGVVDDDDDDGERRKDRKRFVSSRHFFPPFLSLPAFHFASIFSRRSTTTTMTPTADAQEDNGHRITH
jgi:hypothetical protein